jgi:hypothetical protein
MAESKEARNKALVLDAFDTLFNKRDYEAAERYWSPNYIQHSAHIEPGRDGLFNLIRNAPHTLRYEHQLIVTEGDYVIVHGRFSGTGPACCLGRRGYCQDRERPPCRTLGRLTRRGDKSRIEKRPADVWHNVSCVDSFACFACSITRLRKCSGRNK